MIVEPKEMESSSSTSKVIYPTRRLIKSQIKPHLTKYYRRPAANIPFIPSIRVLKRDIRRKYIEMMSNVINSHDATLFSSFVDEFYHPSFSLYYTSPETVQKVFRPLHLEGRDTVKDFLLGSFFLFPDEVHLYSDIKICKRLNESGSRIIGSVEKLGTMIYLPKEINGEPVDRNNTLRDCLPALDSLPPPIHCQEDIVNNFQLSLQPLRMRSRSNYQIVLDENHRITSLYMYYYDLTFTPLPLDEVHRD